MYVIKAGKRNPYSPFICIWCWYCALFVHHIILYFFYAHYFYSNYEFEINIKTFLFQLVNKTTRKIDGKSAPTYNDDYETGGGSTVYIQKIVFFF